VQPSFVSLSNFITNPRNRGGYSRGSASGIGNSDFFDGNDLIHESPLGSPVVVVVIQYRLGLFGFLAGSEVGEKGALNVGLCECFFFVFRQLASMSLS
jgi:hypothetical protein